MRTLVYFLIGLTIGGCLAVSISRADETTINYKGQPVPAAMAPSMSAFSQDVCAVPVSGGVTTSVVGFAGGTVLLDQNCVKLKWSKFLHDTGLKVAAVSLACSADQSVWEALEMSGSPCPIGGAIGDSARQAWYKLHPEWYEKLYGKSFTLPLSTNRSE